MLAGPAIQPSDQARVAAKLGCVPPGSAGQAALRAAFAVATVEYATASKSAKPEYSDLICACLWALAERDGTAATDILASAASSSNPHVRASAISDLAAVGDDRAWEAVMARLTAMLRRRTGLYGVAWHTSCSAIEYLARHAPRGSDRAIRLINLLGDQWHNLADPELINRWWPGIGPGREPAATIDLPAPDRPRAGPRRRPSTPPMAPSSPRPPRRSPTIWSSCWRSTTTPPSTGCICARRTRSNQLSRR
jgi:hypothetical protein